MIEAFDYGILELFQRFQNDIVTFVMKFFTLIGEGGAVWILIGILLLIKKENRKYGVILLLSLLMCLVFGNGLLKNVIARPRPCWRHPEVNMLIPVPQDFSFPSGHTFSSIAAAVSLFHWKKRYGVAAFVLAALIAVSRLYFYVHYPTDILCGAVFGALLAVVSIWIIEKWAAKEESRWLSY